MTIWDLTEKQRGATVKNDGAIFSCMFDRDWNNQDSSHPSLKIGDNIEAYSGYIVYQTKTNVNTFAQGFSVQQRIMI
eukprot:CAMPEP_0116873400 /NCGR_PEP_ID=MMETSP0463-20121206/4490_1 /TAXON_ID=181622 /ORGANISM="Strombidinopsis sp, Strain SopsisLIS2011" /LENGTH=76 /DNA_ID=CAMNT_0004515263 /DNA_START=403 /DNA_END=633 /DNA_ORIENTATION=-